MQTDEADNTYAFHGVYHEILPPERIVHTFEFEDTPGQVSLETMIFEEIGGRTRVTTRSVFQTADDRDEMIRAGMEEGMMDSMDRLAALLGTFKIERKAA